MAIDIEQVKMMLKLARDKPNDNPEVDGSPVGLSINEQVSKLIDDFHNQFQSLLQNMIIW